MKAAREITKFVNFLLEPCESQIANVDADLAAIVDREAVAPLREALQGLMYLTDQGREGGMILSRYDGKPITNADQGVIDRAYLAAEAALKLAGGE
jgi:hypothetical protein